ncbi:MAG: hypothetical protein XXXJIFNMEKO3_02702 [Candidatus Erwinia impunctatus]|nr:hypothetical protein XXXJIFNMEKO_02702 [Culicoides impunctatus]
MKSVTRQESARYREAEKMMGLRTRQEIALMNGRSYPRELPPPRYC